MVAPYFCPVCFMKHEKCQCLNVMRQKMGLPPLTKKENDIPLPKPYQTIVTHQRTLLNIYTEDALLEYADARVEELRGLLQETLQPGAYGVGSTLAVRIESALRRVK